MSKLHLNTISSPLGDALVKIMQTSAFNPFYLAGGTALSLQRGHRQSIDIDLFTDIEYGTLNTTGLSDALLHLFARVDRVEELTQRQMVYSMYVGNEPDEMIKLDYVTMSTLYSTRLTKTAYGWLTNATLPQ